MMKKILFLILLAQSLIFLTFSKPADEPNLSTSEFNALYDLYNATSGRYWKWRNESHGEKWNFHQINPNPCSENWQGITCQCSNELCELKELDLSTYNLTGTLPESVGNWKEISLFNVENNHIRGQIPRNISSWNQINSFNAQHNQLSGSLPNSLWSLRNLSILNLNNNPFIPSTIPVSIGNLTNLRILIMTEIHFYGTIPEIISNCQKIEKLSFEHNNLTGFIPKSIGNLKYLSHLVLSHNYFTGIHDEFFNASSLRWFYVDLNLISSTLSPRIANLVSLIEFDISSNKFYGTLPSALQQIPRLGYVSINSNSFTGDVPTWLSNITTLIRFSASFNNFYGTLPQSLSKIRRLKEFTISTNLVSGSIPSSFQNLSFLQSLDLSYNSLHGSVNVLFDGCHSLKYMILGYNFFSGKINNSESTKLDVIDLPSNQLSGTPPYFDFADGRLLTYLQFGRNYFSGELPINLSESILLFSVDNNYLHGTVPNYIFTSLNLISLNISFNLFSGTFPDSHSSDNRRLQELIVNNNFFVGPLPSSIGFFGQLVSLSLNSNQFTSNVPKSYKNLTALKQFFIQNNLISGSVTELLNNTLSYSLFTVDLSNNQLTGSLVDSYFVRTTLRTFAAVSNCLSGSIPLTVCDAKSLTTFAIDGVSTAKNCRKMIYPILFSGFIVEQYLTGTIPNCLFALPALTTLHLSGNSFTGTISNDLNISASLIDLSLSHNSLSGTVPLFIQERPWTNLDLSYNKLTGTLSSTFVAISNNGSLSLQVNRLSGIIPNSLLSARAINILEGNIFTCNTIEELPEYDPNRSTYSCGSNTVDYILYFWLSLFLVALLLFLMFLRKEDQKSTGNRINSLLKWSLVETVLRELRDWNSTIDEYREKNPNSDLIALLECFKGIRRVCVIMSSLAIFVLLPFYVGLSENSKTYQDGYVWVVSGVLLSGRQSAIALFFVFLMLLLLLFILLFLTFGDTLPVTLKSFTGNKLPPKFFRGSTRFSNNSHVQSTLKETEAELMKSNVTDFLGGQQSFVHGFLDGGQSTTDELH
jgi:Leucine-rich repeat (LRR) protein